MLVIITFTFFINMIFIILMREQDIIFWLYFLHYHIIYKRLVTPDPLPKVRHKGGMYISHGNREKVSFARESEVGI